LLVYLGRLPHCNMQLARKPPYTMRMKPVPVAAVASTSSTATTDPTASQSAIHSFQLSREKEKETLKSPKDLLQVKTTCDIQKLSEAVLKEFKTPKNSRNADIAKWLQEGKTDLEIETLIDKSKVAELSAHAKKKLDAKIKAQRNNDALLDNAQRLETYEEEIDRVIMEHKDKGEYKSSGSSEDHENDCSSVFFKQVVNSLKDFLHEPSAKNTLGLCVALTQNVMHCDTNVQAFKEMLQRELGSTDINEGLEELEEVENDFDMDGLPPCMQRIGSSGEDLITKLSACDWAFLGLKAKPATINFNISMLETFPDVKKALEWKKKIFRSKANFCTQTVRILHNVSASPNMCRQLVLQSAQGILKGNTISFGIEESVYVIKALIDATLEGMKLQAQDIYVKEQIGMSDIPMTPEIVEERHAARLAYLRNFF